MNENDKNIIFSQACNSIGFNINPMQAEVLIAIKDAIDKKEGDLSFNDLNLIVEPYLAKRQTAINPPPTERKYEEQDQD